MDGASNVAPATCTRKAEREPLFSFAEASTSSSQDRPGATRATNLANDKIYLFLTNQEFSHTVDLLVIDQEGVRMARVAGNTRAHGTRR